MTTRSDFGVIWGGGDASGSVVGAGHVLMVPPFRLDPADERVWRGPQPLAVRPKTFAVLRHLVERAGRLVTKNELLDAVWPGTAVSDSVLKSCIRELRHVL